MFVYYDHRNTFTSVHKQEHSTRKKLVADRYTKSYVTKPIVADMIRQHAGVLMKKFQQQPTIDIYRWLHYYAMDTVTNHVYGAYGTKTLEDEAQRDLVYDLSGVKHRTRLYITFYFKDLVLLTEKIKHFYRWIRNQPTGFHVRGSRLSTYGLEKVKSICKDPEIHADSTAGKLYSVIPENPNRIAAECMDHLVAGVDTTGDAMCILMWRISTPEYRHVQEKLFSELLSIIVRMTTSPQPVRYSIKVNGKCNFDPAIAGARFYCSQRRGWCHGFAAQLILAVCWYSSIDWVDILGAGAHHDD
ncbi:hypothetical protein PENDEC_c004G06117 [Penicillium decumbens]|uniref:Uncharacterized protein n=1 Tax=Penicillium decumbens TaxID=69771 RepID=A0A1V6PHV5_PENDC|nr:hypothetical protein PENDEC_c004G06117 [Penicillium decumbens]